MTIRTPNDGTTKAELGSSSELAPASWLDALITNLQAEIDEAGEEGMRANNDGHDKSATACFIIARTLARLRRAVERTQESASNVRISDRP